MMFGHAAMVMIADTAAEEEEENGYDSMTMVMAMMVEMVIG